jgi:hypothetical protein
VHITMLHLIKRPLLLRHSLAMALARDHLVSLAILQSEPRLRLL